MINRFLPSITVAALVTGNHVAVSDRFVVDCRRKFGAFVPQLTDNPASAPLKMSGGNSTIDFTAAVLLDLSGSVVDDPVLDVLVTIPGAGNCTVIVPRWNEPEIRLFQWKTTMPGVFVSCVPWLEKTALRLAPGGNVFVKETFSASAGPKFRTTML